MCQWCGEGWRFETTVLGGPDGGRVKAVLHPISAEWENAYSRVSDGSVLVATRDPAPEDVWSGASGLYISQVLPDGSRRCRFAGEVQDFQGVGAGATRVALKSIDNFLNDRHILGPSNPYRLFVELKTPAGPEQLVRFQLHKPRSVTPNDYGLVYQTAFMPGGYAALGAFLVNFAKGNITGGDPTGLRELTGQFLAPYVDIAATDQTFANWWDFKNIGQAIRDLVERENGIKYQLDSTYSNGYWDTVMTFSQTVGVERDYTILSDREAQKYGLQVNAEDKATRVYGIGSGEEWNTMFSVAYDADTVDNLPERQAVITWKDQTIPSSLDALTRGYVADHRDPVATPSASIMGLPMYDTDAADYDPQRGFPGPEILRPGDTFGVEIGYGVISVADLRARALAVAWTLNPDSTVERTVAMQPVVRPNNSIRTQTPAKVASPVEPVKQPVTPPPTVTPWPRAGLLTTVKQAEVTEVSAMELSFANPGHVWVMDDEAENPQVYCVDVHTGNTYSTFTPNPGASAAPVGDPEAMRYSRVSKKLVLADTGDNDADRPTSGPNQPHLLVVNEPSGGGNKGKVAATRLPIAYPNGARYNVETLLIHPTTDEVFLVQKASSGARVFSYGPLSSMSTTNNVGTLVATLKDITHVSDGTHLWAGGFVAFRSAAESDTVIYKVTGTTWKRVGTIDTPPMKKSESICAESRCAFLTSTEGAKAPIYRVLVPKAFGATCDTPAGPSSGSGGSTGTSTATVPSQLIDFSLWKLQLPI